MSNRIDAPHHPPERQHLINSFGFAWEGLQQAFGLERNFKIHLAITVMVIATGIFCHLPYSDWAILALTIGFMLVTELLNTAIERLTDYQMGLAIHPLAKQVKDISAGACLIAALTAVAVGLVIFIPALNQVYTEVYAQGFTP